MNTSIHQINNKRFKWFELEKETCNLNGFTFYVIHAYKTYPGLSEQQKMELICPAMEWNVRERLQGMNIDIQDEDLYDGLCLLDFRHELQRIVVYHWNKGAEEWKESWRARAAQLNLRPLVGQFLVLPVNLGLVGSTNVEIIRKSLVVDTRALKTHIEKIMSKLRNPPSVRSMKIRTPLSVCIGEMKHIRYLIPTLLCTSLFGERLDVFNAKETIVKKKFINQYVPHSFNDSND